jgi:hypothetical protein
MRDAGKEEGDAAAGSVSEEGRRKLECSRNWKAGKRIAGLRRRQMLADAGRRVDGGVGDQDGTRR